MMCSNHNMVKTEEYPVNRYGQRFIVERYYCHQCQDMKLTITRVKEKHK